MTTSTLIDLATLCIIGVVAGIVAVWLVTL